MSTTAPGAGRLTTGGCFCGEIAAEMHGKPFWVCYDHDDDCRRAIGGPMTIWVGYKAECVRFTKGTPKTFSKTRGVVRSFCGTCGTSIAYRDEGLADETYLSIGFFDRPQDFPPVAHGYWRERLPFVRFDDGLPTIDTYTRDRDPVFGTPDTR